MGFSEAVKTCFSKYITFSGRATRPEYWYFFLFIVLGGIVFGILDAVFFGGAVETTPTGFEASSNGPLASLFNLAVLLPSLTAGWRRMHDTGRSGLFLFYPLIVMIGVGTFLAVWGGITPLMSGNFEAFIAGVGGLIAIVSIVVMVLSPLIVLFWLTRPSQPGDNEFGPANLVRQ